MGNIFAKVHPNPTHTPIAELTEQFLYAEQHVKTLETAYSPVRANNYHHRNSVESHERKRRGSIFHSFSSYNGMMHQIDPNIMIHVLEKHTNDKKIMIPNSMCECI